MQVVLFHSELNLLMLESHKKDNFITLIFYFSEATLSIIGDIPIDEIPGENKPRGPNGDLKQKLYYDSDRGTTGQRLFNGSYQLLPSKFLLIIILASTLPLIKTC